MLTWRSVASGQNIADSLYLLTYADGENRVIALNTTTGVQSIVFSIESAVRGIVENTFPADELALLNGYLVSVQRPTTDAREFVSDVWINSLTPSPDNRSVAVEIKYQRCFEPLTPICFGTTQVILVDALGGQRREVFNVGLNSTSFLDYPLSDPGTQIREIQWFPNQQALSIEVTNRSRSGRTAIVVVPFNSTTPFKIGEGFTSAIAPTSNQIAVLSPNSFEGDALPQLIRIVDFDLSTGVTSNRQHSLGTWLTVDDSQIRYLDSAIVFVVGVENNLDDGGGGLAVLDVLSASASIAIPNMQVVELQSAADGMIVIAETADSTLARITFDGTTLQTQAITDFPVSDWVLNDAGALLVQPAGSRDYQILQLSNAEQSISSLQLDSVLGITQQDEILQVDW